MTSAAIVACVLCFSAYIFAQNVQKTHIQHEAETLSIWDWLNSDKANLALSGMAGAAVSAVMEWEGFAKATRRIFVGFMTALYIGPIGMPLFVWASGISGIPEEHMSPAGGFLVGIGGMFIVEFIIKVWKNLRDRGGKNDNV